MQSTLEAAKAAVANAGLGGDAGSAAAAAAAAVVNAGGASGASAGGTVSSATGSSASAETLSTGSGGHGKSLSSVTTVSMTPSLHTYNEDALFTRKTSGGDVDVIGGNPEGLVKRLCSLDEFDPQYMQNFLYTYKYFLTPFEFLDMLIDCFNGGLDATTTNVTCKMMDAGEQVATEREVGKPMADDEKKRENEGMVVKLRVVNVVKKWLGNHFYDFKENEGLLLGLQEFITRIKAESNLQIFATALEKTIDEKLNPAVVRQRTFSVLELDAVEVAKQLTLIEHELFQKSVTHPARARVI